MSGRGFIRTRSVGGVWVSVLEPERENLLATATACPAVVSISSDGMPTPVLIDSCSTPYPHTPTRLILYSNSHSIAYRVLSLAASGQISTRSSSDVHCSNSYTPVTDPGGSVGSAETPSRIIRAHVNNHKSPRRFAPCRLDADDVLRRSRLRASETQQLSLWPTLYSSVICVELLGQSCQPMTDRLATHPSNTVVCSLSQRSSSDSMILSRESSSDS